MQFSLCKAKYMSTLYHLMIKQLTNVIVLIQSAFQMGIVEAVDHSVRKSWSDMAA